jgi:hypothetical protein
MGEPAIDPTEENMSCTDDVPEIERRIALARKRRGQTYLGQTQDIDDMGGRFARVVKTTVTGTDPIVRYPSHPPNSPWHDDPVGTEPFIDGTGDGSRLGYRIDGGAEPSSAPSDDVGSGIRLRRRL